MKFHLPLQVRKQAIGRCAPSLRASCTNVPPAFEEFSLLKDGGPRSDTGRPGGVSGFKFLSLDSALPVPWKDTLRLGGYGT